MTPLESVLRPIRNRIANLVNRAVVRLVNDASGIQTHQVDVLDNETREGCERFQEYGLTSIPHPGAEAVVLFVGGRRDHGVVVSVDDRRYRLLGLATGEVALYTDEGDYVKLKRGHVVEIHTNAAECSGTVKATGFRVGSNQVVGARESAIASVGAGGSDSDGTARAAINSILTALRAHGLIAS